jgi:hypothetical protein
LASADHQVSARNRTEAGLRSALEVTSEQPVPRRRWHTTSMPSSNPAGSSITASATRRKRSATSRISRDWLSPAQCR